MKLNRLKKAHVMIKLSIVCFYCVTEMAFGAINCPDSGTCWTGSYKFGEWVENDWTEGPWSDWIGPVSYSASPPVGFTGDLVSASLLVWTQVRVDYRAGKDQWKQRRKNNAGGCDEFWGIVLPSNYERSPFQCREQIMVTITNYISPDESVSETIEASDVTLPEVVGFKTMVSHTTPATSRCQ